MYHEQSVTLSNGVSGEIIAIPTANPASYFEAISEAANMETAEIYGQLFFPSDVNQPDIVIVVPGSLGVAPSHLYKAEVLTDAGYAACVIDPFGMRGVTSTVANQAQYTFAASAYDVLATVSLLTKDDRIDSNRIGAQGHSRGGTAVLNAATMAQLMKDDFPLAGVYAAYPWSGHQFQNPVLGNTKVRSIIGEKDEWCLPQQVQGHMNTMAVLGGDASFCLIEGAQHSFDRETGVELIEDASVSPGAPTVFITSDGTLVDPRTSTPDPALTERDLMVYGVKSGHGVKGAKIGTAGNQSDLFHQDMMNFWERVFG